MIEVYDADFYFLNPLKETLFINFLEEVLPYQQNIYNSVIHLR